MAHTVIELPAPSYHHDCDGNVRVDWEITPPEGFDDAVDEHTCAAGAECAHERAMTVGFRLWETEDGRGGCYWTAWLVDGRWVVCEDCANAIADGDLSVSLDGVWSWKQEAD